MRQMVEDSGSAPIVNLAAMPHFNYQIAGANVFGNSIYLWRMGSAPPTFTTAFDTADVDPGGISTVSLSHTVTAVAATSPTPFERAYNLSQSKWVAAGDVLRWAFWIKTPAACFIQPYWEGLKSDGSTYASSTLAGNAPAPISVAANTWTRIVATQVISATADGWRVARCGWLVSGYTTVVGEVWKLGACVITMNQALPPYDVSGDTPGWAWQGAAGGSAASGWPLPVSSVVNLFRNPQCAVDLTGYKVVSTAGGPGGNFSATRIATGGPSGGSFYRVTWNTTSSVGAVTNSDLLFFGDQTWADPQQVNRAVCSVQPGQTYAGTVWVRCSQAVQVHLQLQMLTNTGSATGTGLGSDVTLAPNIWTQLTAMATAGANATAIRMDVDVTSSNLVWNAGDTFDATMVSLTATPTVYPFADGSLPMWNWTGKPGQSMSFGPAYTLANLAGTPSAYLQNVTAGTTVAPLPVSGDYTIFAVQSVPDTAAAPGMWDTGGQNRRLLATGTGFRLDVAITTGVKGIATNAVDFSVPHISVGRVNDTGMRCLVDGVYYTNEPATVLAEPHGPTALKAGVRDGNVYPQVTTNAIGLIPAYLDDWTAARVTGWLARQYNLPVPLEEIAGPPLLAKATAGSSTALTIANLGGLQGRTLYFVHDISAAEVADTTTYPNVGTWRDTSGTSLGQMEITHAGPQNGIQTRIDTTAGTNFNVRLNGVRTVGRHVSAASVNDGMTLGTLDYDDMSGTFAVTPGAGMPFNSSVIAPSTDVVFLAAYGQMHDPATRKKIMAWLARQYGATPPAGY